MQERERFRPLSVGVRHDLGSARHLLKGRREKIRIAERVPTGNAHRVVNSPAKRATQFPCERISGVHLRRFGCASKADEDLASPSPHTLPLNTGGNPRQGCRQNRCCTHRLTISLQWTRDGQSARRAPGTKCLLPQPPAESGSTPSRRVVCWPPDRNNYQKRPGGSQCERNRGA